jgi:5-hydroxyisourate hydrolase
MTLAEGLGYRTLMPDISIHVFDVSRGIAAAGLRVEVTGPDGRRLLDATTTRRGTLECGTPATGLYEATFHVGAWYRAQGIAIPDPAFLEVVPFRFGVADLAQHYHLPLKMTPWGLSLFRGGA